MRFINESGLEFVDISSETYREYVFGDKASVRVEEPLFLHVSESGHRILDSVGVSHYVPSGWVHLRWKAKEGSPHFVL